ncbi:MAG: phosphate starvation-inducible protein PhoH [Actinomycetota bacterium]|nr:phosphate starvation-inducible protein PhoH [Actinomycetota bacterium]
MRPLLLLDARTSIRPIHEDQAVRDQVDVIDLYDLASADLTPYVGLVVAGMADQELLWARREVIASFLDQRKVVIFCGHLLRHWLPGCETFVPAPITSFRDYAIHIVEPGTIFAGLDAHDLTFRRGVAGFFARGHHPPPAGAEVLATLAGGQPTTWIDRRTTAGTVFTHAGDLFGFADADSTAARLVPQLLDWAAAEGSRSCGA